WRMRSKRFFFGSSSAGLSGSSLPNSFWIIAVFSLKGASSPVRAELKEAGRVLCFPTSQNRDVGHPKLVRGHHLAPFRQQLRPSRAGGRISARIGSEGLTRPICLR